MCKAKMYTSQLLEIYNNVQSEYDTIENKLKLINGRQQDLLHMIENSNLNASQGYNVYKVLKELRVERRELKDEIKPLEELLKLSQISKISEMKEVYDKIDRIDQLFKKASEGTEYKSREKAVEKGECKKQSKIAHQNQLRDKFIHNANTKSGVPVCIIKELDNGRYNCIFKDSKGAYYTHDNVKSETVVKINQ